MEIKYLTVKDLVTKRDIVIEHIRNAFILADPLTKGLKPIAFKEHVVNMGVTPHPPHKLMKGCHTRQGLLTWFS